MTSVSDSVVILPNTVNTFPDGNDQEIQPANRGPYVPNEEVKDALYGTDNVARSGPGYVVNMYSAVLNAETANDLRELVKQHVPKSLLDNLVPVSNPHLVLSTPQRPGSTYLFEFIDRFFSNYIDFLIVGILYNDYGVTMMVQRENPITGHGIPRLDVYPSVLLYRTKEEEYKKCGNNRLVLNLYRDDDAVEIRFDEAEQLSVKGRVQAMLHAVQPENRGSNGKNGKKGYKKNGGYKGNRNDEKDDGKYDGKDASNEKQSSEASEEIYQ